MVFSSITFLCVFLPLSLITYYAFRGRRRVQNRILLILSLMFYAWGEPLFVFVMMGVVIFDWGFALLIERKPFRSHGARAIAAIAITTNIVLLIAVKYVPPLTRAVCSHLGFENCLFSGYVLPIGISFFTFQSISYVIDVYRGSPAQKNLLDLGLYIALFPQLVAGPIVRYKDITQQLYGRNETIERFVRGTGVFVIGLSKKVLLANSLGLVADHAFATNPASSTLTCWIGLVCYTLQIYCDFSGYSDMAVGLGRMFGFELPKNFDYPYISSSVSEFWRRWHISLGLWFRDYVYFPMGGSRVSSKGRLAINLLTVWLLTGIWHGANLTFVGWGLFYYVLVLTEKLSPLYRNALSKNRVLGHGVTMLFVMMGWVLFRSEGLSSALDYYAGLFGAGRALWCDASWVLLKENLFFIISACLVCLPLPTELWKRFSNRYENTAGWLTVVYISVLFMAAMAFIVKSTYNPFIYFNF